MKLLRKIGSFLKDVTGESDYARYCAHLRERHPERPVPSQKEFYLTRVNESYSRPNRCC